jgi:hypothetical protein
VKKRGREGEGERGKGGEGEMKKRIRSHVELEVHKKAFDAAMEIFEASKKFPAEGEAAETQVWL